MINSTDLRKHALNTVAFGYSKRQTDAVKELGHPAPKIQQGMITPRQISVINQILRSVGCTDAAKAKEFINGFTPRPIDHISDLTEADAEQTIDKIQKGDAK